MGENKTEDKFPRSIKLKDEFGNESIHYDTTITSGDCPDEIKQYAERELNETEENRRNGILKLKAYIKREKLPEIEDVYLVAVLRCCKYNIKKSEVKLKKMLNVRRMIIKNIKKVDSEKLKRFLDSGSAYCLPWTDKNGRPIYVFKLNIDMDSHDYHDFAAFCQAGTFAALTYPLPTIKGVAAIIDCNMPPSWALLMINEYRKYLDMEKTIPYRIARIDFVNSNVIIHYVYALIRPFLPSKICNRMAFHGSDLTELHKIYHPDILPEELGGTLGPLDANLFKEDKRDIINKLRAINVT